MATRSRQFHSKEELEGLLAQASKYIEREWYTHVPITCFYRDKTEEYFKDVEESGWMRKYAKDNNGDPRSPINGNIDGLHFSVNVGRWTRCPAEPSVFGPMRLEMPAKIMFETCPNLYFTDFYCYSGRSIHHVILVMTRTGSEEDKFCKRHLPQLDLKTNPFLRCTSSVSSPELGGSSDISVEVLLSKVWIEVLFTEDIDINKAKQEGATVKRVSWKGNQRTGPKPKDSMSSHCTVKKTELEKAFECLKLSSH